MVDKEITIEREKTEKTTLPSIYYDETIQEDYCKTRIKIIKVSGETSKDAYETFKKVKEDLK